MKFLITSSDWKLIAPLSTTTLGFAVPPTRSTHVDETLNCTFAAEILSEPVVRSHDNCSVVVYPLSFPIESSTLNLFAVAFAKYCVALCQTKERTYVPVYANAVGASILKLHT